MYRFWMPSRRESVGRGFRQDRENSGETVKPASHLELGVFVFIGGKDREQAIKAGLG